MPHIKFLRMSVRPLLLSCSFLALGVAVPALAEPQTAPNNVETLGAAVADVTAHNPTVEQALAAHEAASHDIDTEWSGYFPTVTASTAVGRVYGDNATSRGLSVTRGAGYSNMWEGSLAINQTLFDGLKTKYAVDAAKARAAASGEAIADTKGALALQMTLSYLNVLRLRESYMLLQSYQNNLAGYEEKIASMVENGAADNAELQQAHRLGLDLKEMMVGMEGQIKSADAEYARLTGHLPASALERPAPMNNALPATAEEAVKVAMASHPQIRAAGDEITAAERTTDIQKTALYPTVSAELSAYQKDIADVIGGEIEDSRAVVRMNWELSTGGAELAQIEKAKAQAVQTRFRKQDIERRLAAAIRTAYADLETADAQKKIIEEKLATDQATLGAHQAQFEGGKVRILQLLQSENQVLSAKLDLLNIDYRTQATGYSLLGSIGKLYPALVPRNDAVMAVKASDVTDVR